MARCSAHCGKGGAIFNLRLLFKELKSEAVHSARGRSFYLRLPILIYLAYVFIRHLTDPNYESILYPLTVGTHELGHFAFSWMGEFMGVLGGLTFQLGVPIVAIFNFYFLGDFFALFFSFGWLSTSLFLIARYVTDARVLGAPLLGPFSERNIVKDWNYFLTRADLLPYARFIAFFCKVLACAAMLICLIGGLWFLIQAKKNSSRAKS
jgi:hypothetical protein